MANIIRGTVLTAAAGATLAIAFWAMWTMLGAAFDGDWLQVALALMLWMAAVGATHSASLRPMGG
jgi:hypothetical protein